MKLWARVRCLIFLTHSVVIMQICDVNAVLGVCFHGCYVHFCNVTVSVVDDYLFITSVVKCNLGKLAFKNCAY